VAANWLKKDDRKNSHDFGYAMKFAAWTRFAAVAAALAGLVAAGVSSMRVGWADYLIRKDTLTSVESAIALTPKQAGYYVHLAWLLSADNPQKAQAALRNAVALNPLDARAWIELGLRAEAGGDNITAQQYFVRAADADKGYLPRWTLANYYFRHDDTPMFWYWAKQAAGMMYGDGRPLFQLCGRLQEDGRLIERLDIRNPTTRAAYLTYLVDRKQIDLLSPAARSVSEASRIEDVPLLLQVCDRFLEARRVEEATEIWNRLADQGRVPSSTPDEAQLGANSDFRMPPTSHGFDWRLPAMEGISASLDEFRGLQLTLSGRQPEDCELLAQLIPLRPGTKYKLQFNYRLQGMSAGLEWRITDAKDGRVLGEGAGPTVEGDGASNLPFETPAEFQLARLALRYHRSAGTIRSEGVLVLRSVSLKPVFQSLVDGSRVRK